jgi:hypothetical protein
MNDIATVPVTQMPVQQLAIPRTIIAAMQPYRLENANCSAYRTVRRQPSAGVCVTKQDTASKDYPLPTPSLRRILPSVATCERSRQSRTGSTSRA